MKKKTNTALIFILAALSFSLIAAYIIEYGLGHKPCKLCVYQRIPYFFSIFLILNILLIKKYVKPALLLLALISLSGSILGFYHFGIEQGFFSESLVCEAQNLDQDLSKAILPVFTIERIIRSSDVFKQGRVHVTVSEETNDKSLRLLCDSLTNRFNEFSNIVICLYADNYIGKEHAMGNYEDINAEEQKRIWLAMYTYNSVEGAYFDNNPSDYLGTY